jgi:hypothetical protein
METLVSKVVLGTGKEVLLREIKIKHQELAMRAVGSAAGDNSTLLAYLTQKEMLKMLIVQINGKDMKPAELEDLDELFSYAEFMQLAQVLGQLAGGSDMGKFQLELVSSGGQ